MAAVTIKKAGVKGRLWHLRGGRGVSEKAHRDLDAARPCSAWSPPPLRGADTNSRRVLFGRHEFGISG
jgi:hypothetical protein